MHFINYCAHNNMVHVNSHLSTTHQHTDHVNKTINKYITKQHNRMIDRGNVGVVLFNFGPEDFEVAIGDRIAQLILEQISMVPAVQVEELTETERGAGGFGSTGVSNNMNDNEGSVEKKKARTISPTDGVQQKMME